MNPKSILISILAIFSVFNISCFDRNNYTAGAPDFPVEEENTMNQMLVSTFENVNDTVPLAFRGRELTTTPLIKKFYSENQYLPVWTTAMKPNHDGRELMRLFAKAAFYGLDTSFYQFTSLKELYYILRDEKEHDLSKKAVEYELLMTHNCFKLMSHLHTGVLYPDTAIYGKQYTKFPRSFAIQLGEFVNNGRVTEGILDLQPKNYQYRQLQKGLEAFLTSMNLTTDSFELPDPKADSLLAYKKAKEILATNNFFDQEYIAKEYANNIINDITDFELVPVEYTYDYKAPLESEEEFINALKSFQKDHGLHPDGKIGERTRNALLQNNRERFEQIAVNLERLRWEKRRPARYVYVNLPSYKLRVVDKYMIQKTYIVVVGAPWFKTPLLNSEIEYFTTNPKWYVPVSISKNEILPKIKKDSTYLARHGYRVYDTESNPVVEKIDWSKIEAGNFNLRFQQNAGSGNAMGKIKYYFDSGENNVLIHDTNDKSKFKKDIRAYSHGCIRIAEPVKFGTTLVGLDRPNTADSVEIWVNTGQRKRYVFEEPIPLYVRYITCEANSKSHITFYPDIYGKDKELKKQLFASREI
jgi:murein L,D-transpeptidase YcbB/YkuD